MSMYESPVRLRRRTTSQFRGDKFLRLTPEESDMVADAEIMHGYDPHPRPTIAAFAARLTAPVPPGRNNTRASNPLWKYVIRRLIRRLAMFLLEWTEE